MISIFNTIMSHAEDFDGMTFNRITESGHLKNLCNQIKEAGDDHNKVSQLKKKLPAVTWQAYQQRGTNRSAAMCTANGLFIIDVDHIDDPRGLWQRIEKENKHYEKDEIMVAHVTPSGRGLRIVAKRYNTRFTIAECQDIFCSHYNIECDKAVKDLSRLSFLVPKDYFLLFNPEVFDYQWEASSIEQTQAMLGLTQNANLSHAENAEIADIGEKVEQIRRSNENYSLTSHPSPLTSEEFMGIKYKDLVDAVIERTGGTPQVGERNTRLYELARMLRYTVDFDAFLLEQILPSFDLPQSEVQSTVRSAVNSTRSERMPEKLSNIIEELKDLKDLNDNGNEEGVNVNVSVPVAPLPPVFQEFASIAPNGFKEPTLFSLLPILGTLASTARATYIDGQVHSPSFITVVSAPQASGKSFARHLVLQCMQPLLAEDQRAIEEEREYRKALQKAKNSSRQPEEPESVRRSIPASISVAKLLKRLDNAKGLHLFTFCEEMDTVAKANSAGAWAQKSDLYRNAFDNAVYGQDYMSDSSYSATLQVFYNLLILGTPKAIERYFKDYENGLVSRVCFSSLADQFGAPIPIWGVLSEDSRERIYRICKGLFEKFSDPSAPHFYDLQYVNKALYEWNERQRHMAIENMSISRDTCRRRAAVVGFRAALLAEAIADVEGVEPDREAITAFATYIADLHLETMLTMFESKIEESMETAKKPTVQQESAFQSLPAEFTRSDLAAALKRLGRTTPVRNVVSCWKSYGMIEVLDRVNIRKL